MFNENSVKLMVLDMLCTSVTSNTVTEELANYYSASNRDQGGLLHGI
jgi:hypothetical protein